MDLGLSFLAPIAKQQEMDAAQQKLPLELEHLQSLARLQRAQATQMETSAEGERRVGAVMAQRLGQGQSSPTTGDFSRVDRGQDGGATPTPAPQSFSTMLKDIAGMYAEAGMPSKATAAMEHASAAEAHENAAAHSKGQVTAQRAKLISDLMGGVRTAISEGTTPQEAWDAANKAFETQTGEKSPLSGKPYDANMVSVLGERAMTAYQRALLEARGEDDKSKAKAREDATATRAVQRRVAEARIRYLNQRTARLGKEGGKDVGAPTKAEMDQAGALLDANKDLVFADAAERTLATNDIASQARARRKANPGLSADEAMRQTLQEMRENGDLSTETSAPAKILGKEIPFTGGKKSATYGTAQALPKSGKASDLVVGKRYRNAAGVVKQWTKDGWKEAAMPKTSAASPVDDEEEE